MATIDSYGRRRLAYLAFDAAYWRVTEARRSGAALELITRLAADCEASRLAFEQADRDWRAAESVRP
jgi:hypothetical protein